MAFDYRRTDEVAYQLQARTISETILKPANDVGRLLDFTPRNLLARALAAWAVTLVIGGIALEKGIAFVAHLFQVSEFAELQHMGFLMAGVLGIGLAAALVIDALRDTHTYG